MHVIMEHKTMPIAAALGFLMELAVVCSIGGLIGGATMRAVINARVRKSLDAASPESRDESLQEPIVKPESEARS